MKSKLLCLCLLAIASITLGVTKVASAAVPGPFMGTAVTDYPNYPSTPQAQINPGCTPAGITGSTYQLNGGATFTDLRQITSLNQGDTVVWTWGQVSAACMGSLVTLVVKDAAGPTFDASKDQNAVKWSSIYANGAGSLTLVLPQLPGDCNLQLDSVLGAPLLIVGPHGSFYTASNRTNGGIDTLFSAFNGAYGTCTPTTTVITTPPIVTVPTSSTTTPPDVVITTVPTTTPPTVTTAPPPTTPFSVVTTATTAPRCANSAALLASCQSNTATILAVTGPHDIHGLNPVGLVLIALGLVGLAIFIIMIARAVKEPTS